MRMNLPIELFIMLAAPLLIAAFLLRGDARRFAAFFLLGLGACLFAAYINSFLSLAAGMDIQEATIKLTPIIEEVLKALPVFFYLAVYAPKRGAILAVSVAVGLGFATLENAYYIMNIADQSLLYAVIRGFSAGAIHTVCAAILGYGLTQIYRRQFLTFPISFALLCAASTLHAMYNLFVTSGGVWAATGYLLPIAAAGIMLPFLRRISVDEGLRERETPRID
ncbi:MAG: PrsW family intramembrane metalloprotease [Clostridiales Family XIII bacterium]|jgi:RsiW-degrading membrane proteinase PrsW (M82 family)|nr:PrsW family intramembrane metalloprotease [Clostridiales Family XIII bacterium]